MKTPKVGDFVADINNFCYQVIFVDEHPYREDRDRIDVKNLSNGNVVRRVYTDIFTKLSVTDIAKWRIKNGF